MSDLNDNREGGLFSDDYEVPKRENPYKKKKKETEDAAVAYLREEDEPVEQKRENPYLNKNKRKKKYRDKTAEEPMDKPAESREAPPIDESRVTLDRDGAHLERRKIPVKERWNNFIFTHVKLICFIGGVILVLLFISAPAIYYGIQDAHEAAEREEKEPLTFTYIQGLTDRAEPPTWKDFEKFYYKEEVNENGVTWFVPVEDGDRFEIWISGESTTLRPVYVHLYDFDTGAEADLTEGSADLEEFLKQIS